MNSATAIEIVPGFKFSGPPRTKKTSNRVVKIAAKGSHACRACGNIKGFAKVLPSEAFESWQKGALEESYSIKAQLRDIGVELPIPHVVSVRALFFQDVDRADSCGLFQGLGDLLQEAGFLVNDRQIADWDGSRRLVDKANPRVEVYLTILRRVAVEQPLFAGAKK